MARPFLSPGAVRRLRARSVAAMLATCTVERRAGAGQPWAPAAGLTGLRCDFAAEAATNEGVAADAAQATTLFRVKFDPDQLPAGAPSIASPDRLVITHAKPGVASPLVLFVRGQQPRGALELTRSVLATLTAAGG